MYNTDKIDYNDYMFKQIYTSVVGGLATKSPTNSQIDEHQLVGVAMTLTQKAYGALQDKIEWQGLRKKLEQPVYHASPEYGNHNQINLSPQIDPLRFQIEPSFWNTKNNFYTHEYSQIPPFVPNNTTAFTSVSAKPNANTPEPFKFDEDTKRRLDTLMEDINKTMLNTPSSYNFQPYNFSAYTTSESWGKEASCTQDEFRAKTDNKPLSAFNFTQSSITVPEPDQSQATVLKDLQQTINQLVKKVDEMLVNNQGPFTGKTVKTPTVAEVQAKK